MKKVHWKSLCPCESGKIYRHCCWEKEFTWKIKNNGEIFQEIPINEEVMDIFKKELANFKSIYNREPEDSDLIFSSFPSEKYLTKELSEIMHENNIRPELIYAFEKTGLLVNELNIDLLAEQDLQEWEDAIDEYHEIIAPFQDDLNKYKKESENNIKELSSSIEKSIVILELIIYKYGEAKNIKNENKGDYVLQDFIFLCLTKSLKSLKAIKLLNGEYFGQDILVIVRTIYENYLNISFLIKNPEKIHDLVTAKVGLKTGDCKYKYIKQKEKKKKMILHIKTGKLFEKHISISFMASNTIEQIDNEIHKFLYDYLSDFSHPSIFAIEAYLDEHKFDSYNSEREYHSYLYTTYSSFLLLDCFFFFSSIEKRIKKDIFNIIHPMAKLLQINFQQLEYDENKQLPQYFVNRLENSLKRWGAKI